jgi:hypothetical protein
MSSMRFLTAILFHLIDLSSPFRRARPPWQGQTVEVIRWALMVVLLGGPALVCSTVSFISMFAAMPYGVESSINLYCNSSLAIPVFLLGVMWPSLAAFLVSPIVLRQREHRSWDTVLATPFPRRDILTGMIATSLSGFEGLLQAALAVQGFMSVVACLHAFNLAGLRIQSLQCLLVGPLVAALSVVERLQEAALSLLLGVIISHQARSWPMAATGALVAGVVVRLAQIWLVVMVALAANPATAEWVFRDTLFMGSTALIRFSWWGALIPLALIGLRELLFRGLTAWMLREMGGE